MVDISELTESVKGYIEELQAKLHLKPSQIAIVEDTVKTLDYIRTHSDFVTVHVSSFME